MNENIGEYHISFQLQYFSWRIFVSLRRHRSEDWVWMLLLMKSQMKRRWKYKLTEMIIIRYFYMKNLCTIFTLSKRWRQCNRKLMMLVRAESKHNFVDRVDNVAEVFLVQATYIDASILGHVHVAGLAQVIHLPGCNEGGEH